MNADCFYHGTNYEIAEESAIPYIFKYLRVSKINNVISIVFLIGPIVKVVLIYASFRLLV